MKKYISIIFSVIILSSISGSIMGCSQTTEEEFRAGNEDSQLEQRERDIESKEKNEVDKDDEIDGGGRFTGYFLKTDSRYFFISEQENDTFYKDEPVKISPPSWDEDTTVNFSSFSNGDKIEVLIFQIGDTEPRDMPVYNVELISEGTMENISGDVIQYLEKIGYKIIEE